MTLQQIAARINKNEIWLGNNMNCEEARAWENYGKQRIYFGREFIEIKDGKAQAPVVAAKKGYYESNSAFMDRMDWLQKHVGPEHVIVRYINILLSK